MDDLFVTYLNKLLVIGHFTWFFSGLLFGALAVLVQFLHRRRQDFLCLLAALPPLAIILTMPIPYFFAQRFGLFLPKYQIYTFAIEAIIGYVATFIAFLKYAPNINNFFQNLFKRNFETRTDVRHIHKSLPDQIPTYDPKIYFDKSKGIFLGREYQKKRWIPVYVSYQIWRECHKDIVGCSRFGKGVISCVILYQLIKLYLEAIFVFAPKEDEWAPHVLKQACDEVKTTFSWLNLNAGQPPQINLLACATSAEIEDLFIAGFGLAEKGKESDVYRIEDRHLAFEAANIAFNMTSPTFKTLYEEMLRRNPDFHKDNKFFSGCLREVASLESINAETGLDLTKIITESQVCYVQCSMDNSRVLKAQKMLLLRIIQIARNVKRQTKANVPVGLFLDEFKYLISNITLQALGTSLGLGVHAILAHQSLEDLRGTSADLDPDMVKGAVLDNTAIKICYGQENPVNAEFYARKSGTIQVETQTRLYQKQMGVDLAKTDSSAHQADRNYIDANMLLHLPRFCAVMYGIGLAKIIFTSFIKVDKHAHEFEPIVYPLALSQTVPSKVAKIAAKQKNIKAEIFPNKLLEPKAKLEAKNKPKNKTKPKPKSKAKTTSKTDAG